MVLIITIIKVILLHDDDLRKLFGDDLKFEYHPLFRFKIRQAPTCPGSLFFPLSIYISPSLYHHPNFF